jgi:CRISPR/Cas system CSM-associated protein Csm3 (group 7 of RAMP superfamily)
MMTLRTDRLLIEYTLAFNTPFHCGTGIRESLIDRTVVRDSGGYLYVPGSTLKGVLRDRCEQIARFYAQDEAKPGTNTGESKGTDKGTEDTGMRGVPSPHDARAALEGLGKSNPTMITRIFGSQNKPGLLFFDDAYQKNDDKLQYDSPEEHDGQGKGKGKYQGLQVSVSTQVRLDRPTRTAVPGALYTSEFGNNDITFHGTIQGWITCTPIPSDAVDIAGDTGGTPTYSLLLLLAGLRMLERLGGNKSTGKGYCECTIGKIELDGKEVDWQVWLQMLDALAHYDKEGSA